MTERKVVPITGRHTNRRKRRQNPQPSLPPGRYVVLLPDGTPQDPPILLDQRLTDAELRELVDGIQAKLEARRAPAPTMQPDEPPASVDPPSTDEETPPAEATLSQLKATMAQLAEDAAKPMTDERADSILAANGIRPAPQPGPLEAPSPSADTKADEPTNPPTPEVAAAPAVNDGWADAGLFVYKGLCLFVGSLLCGLGVVSGGWMAVKSLPALDMIFTGNPPG